MKRLFRAHTFALALALCVGGAARADVLPPSQVSWTYNFAPAAPAVFADGNPGSSVAFTNESQKAATGPSDVVATNLRTSSASSAASPDTLSTNGAYALNLTLTETEGGVTNTATLTFHGKLSGSFSKESALVTNAFGPDATQSVTLGSYTFSVSMIAYTPPGPPDQTNAGSISAHVSIAANGGTGGGAGGGDAPEPSTMVLAGLGLSFLGFAGWRKRRAKTLVSALA
jgi:hypothetical protein